MAPNDQSLLTYAQQKDVLEENRRLRAVNDALVRRNTILVNREKEMPCRLLPLYTMDTVHKVRDELV